VLQLPTAEEVLALEPDLSLIPAAMAGAIGAYPAGSGHAFELRTFAPGAVPATYRVSQGARAGRAGPVEITADPDGTAWVGGAATVCIRGSITL
jgi:predicted PhzF superfamily epimerase YddE/YHI9